MSAQKKKELSSFDRLASKVDQQVSRAWFFAACLMMVVIWAPSILLFKNVDTWQLVINTTTTIVTFLLVALLQNTQHRSGEALHEKLNAMIEALADLMESHESGDPSIALDVEKLRRASGLEERRGT